MKNIERKKLIQHYYSSRAEDYDKQKSRTWKTAQGFGNEVTDKLLKTLNSPNIKHVLEVGVGTGRNALLLLENIKTRFVGLDLTKEMLKAAKTKLASSKKDINLILGDAEYLPFAEEAFDAVVCMSALHYFALQESVLGSFSRILKESGTLVCGDLTLHELDDEKFLETLERTLSKAHTGYHKPSETKRLLENSGFQITGTKSVAYRKSYHALIEDKGRYFGATLKALNALVQRATVAAKEQYELGDAAMTLYYTVTTAQRKMNPSNLMVKQSIGIKVPKAKGEKMIVQANKLQIINKELEIQRDANSIYVPLIRQPSEDELKVLRKQARNCEISICLFTERKKRKASFVGLLKDKLPAHLLASLPHSADIVGDIAIIEVPPELEVYANVIGEAFLKANGNVRSVLAKASAVSGTYRLRQFRAIAGENKTETIHKEHGCQYYVDVSKAYFSPRLSYEHNRVASLVKEGETIVDLFAGVGPFAVLIAEKHDNIKVYAVDVNPDAVKLLKKNIRLNRVDDKINPILGDARQVVKKKLSGIADRVIMNLPEKAIDFVDVACKALKTEGGVIHFYGFINASNSIEDVQSCFAEAAEKSGRKVKRIISSKKVRATAPYEWQIVIDVIIR